MKFHTNSLSGIIVFSILAGVFIFLDIIALAVVSGLVSINASILYGAVIIEEAIKAPR